MRMRQSLWIVLLATAVELSAAPQQTRGTGLVVGHVVDGSSGAGIADAFVALGQSVLGGIRVRTDAEGGFVFTGLAPGTYGVRVTKPGYAAGGFGVQRPNGELRPLELAEGQRLADVKLKLWKFGSISGVVLDEVGEPVVGVAVRALRAVAQAGRRRLLTEGTAPTDDRGMYRIGSLLPGDYMAAVTMTYSTVPASVYQPPPPNLTTVESRAPIFGVPFDDVLLIAAAPWAVRPEFPVAGAFSIVPTTFHPSALTPAQARAVTLASGENKAGVDIRLSPVPTTRVSGSLVGPTGPVGLFPVRLIPRWTDDLGGEANFEIGSTMTDAAGHFSFVGVTPGAYLARASKVLATSAESLWAAEPVTVGTQPATVLLTMRTGRTISGRFEFDGSAPRPASERLRQIPVMIESIDAQSGATPSPRRTNADATFQLTGVPPGRYFVRISGPPARWFLKSVTHDGRDITETAVDVKDADLTGITITFTDRPTEITGRVRTPEGAADPDATVLIFPANSEGWVDFGLNPGRLHAERPDAASLYAVTVLPGDYYVIAVPEESTGGWRDSKILEVLSRRARRVQVLPGATTAVDLVTVR